MIQGSWTNKLLLCALLPIAAIYLILVCSQWTALSYLKAAMGSGSRRSAVSPVRVPRPCTTLPSASLSPPFQDDESEPLAITPQQSCVSCNAFMEHHRCGRVCSQENSWNDTSSNHLLRALNNTSILLVGDSLPWQLSHAMQCFTGHPSVNITVGFEGMHLFPLDEESFELMLEDFLQKRTYHAIIFGIGTWYNIYQNETRRQTTGNTTSNHFSNNVTERTTMDIFQNHCPSSLREYYSKESRAYERAQRSRSECPDLTRLSSYISGLLRLRNVLEKDRTHAWPLAIWKDVAPQHFEATASGMWLAGAPATKACKDIENKSYAYERNRIANDILGGSNRIAFARTWEKDVLEWNLHPGRDCTHFCNPSATTWNWVTEVMNVIVENNCQPA